MFKSLFIIFPRWLALSDLYSFISSYLNKNYLFKFDNSIVSSSVTFSCPSVYPYPIPNIANYFINSQPNAPAPIINIFYYYIFITFYNPNIYIKLSYLLFIGYLFNYSSYSGNISNTS